MHMALERVARHSRYNLNYHVVMTPKYRYAVLGGKVAELLTEVLRSTCAERDWIVLGLEVMPDHVHIFLSSPPKWSPSDVVKILKGVSARRVLQAFPRLSRHGHFWTNAFYVGTAGSVSSQTIQQYILNQHSKQEADDA
jgi:putative transposase